MVEHGALPREHVCAQRVPLVVASAAGRERALARVACVGVGVAASGGLLFPRGTAILGVSPRALATARGCCEPRRRAPQHVCVPTASRAGAPRAPALEARRLLEAAAQAAAAVARRERAVMRVLVPAAGRPARGRCAKRVHVGCRERRAPSGVRVVGFSSVSLLTHDLVRRTPPSKYPVIPAPTSPRHFSPGARCERRGHARARQREGARARRRWRRPRRP